jgi:RNA polymerase sigma-70 factor (ECF subfamily)
LNSFEQRASPSWETEELFAECRDNLVRYLRYHLDDRSAAEDIAQESFIRFFQARSREEEITQPKAWLFRVAHNLLIDLGRKKKPELLDENGWLRLESRMGAGPSGTEAKVEVSQLHWDRLTSAEMECLRLRAEGLKFREISDVLELSISTVASYIGRAVKKLKDTGTGESGASKPGRTTATL